MEMYRIPPIDAASSCQRMKKAALEILLREDIQEDKCGGTGRGVQSDYNPYIFYDAAGYLADSAEERERKEEVCRYIHQSEEAAKKMIYAHLALQQCLFYITLTIQLIQEWENMGNESDIANQVWDGMVRLIKKKQEKLNKLISGFLKWLSQ